MHYNRQTLQHTAYPKMLLYISYYTSLPACLKTLWQQINPPIYYYWLLLWQSIICYLYIVHFSPAWLNLVVCWSFKSFSWMYSCKCSWTQHTMSITIGSAGRVFENSVALDVREFWASLFKSFEEMLILGATDGYALGRMTDRLTFDLDDWLSSDTFSEANWKQRIGFPSGNKIK